MRRWKFLVFTSPAQLPVHCLRLLPAVAVTLELRRLCRALDSSMRVTWRFCLAFFLAGASIWKNESKINSPVIRRGDYPPSFFRSRSTLHLVAAQRCSALTSFIPPAQRQWEDFSFNHPNLCSAWWDPTHPWIGLFAAPNIFDWNDRQTKLGKELVLFPMPIDLVSLKSGPQVLVFSHVWVFMYVRYPIPPRHPYFSSTKLKVSTIARGSVSKT